MRRDEEGKLWTTCITFPGGGGNINGVRETPAQVEAEVERVRASGEEWVIVSMEGSGHRVGFHPDEGHVVTEAELRQEGPQEK
jgi:hypothetical protein